MVVDDWGKRVLALTLSLHCRHRRGRRDTALLITNLIVFVGIALEVLSVPFNLYELYMVGHFLVGCSQGLLPAGVIYIAESVPDDVRG